MRKSEYKEMQTVQKIATSETLICDKCNKAIYKKDIEKSESYGRILVDWYSVTTGHYDWGNDSCESVREYDICPACIGEVFSEYVARSHGKDKHNTEYIEIEHDFGYYDYTETEGDVE